MSSSYKLDVKNSPSQQPMACNKSTIAMGVVSWKVGIWEVARCTTIAQLKMHDACIFCNIIEIVWWKEVTKTKMGGPSSYFKLQLALAQSCKNTLIAYLCKHPNISIARRRDWSVRCQS
jgi:hypothetical protein